MNEEELERKNKRIEVVKGVMGRGIKFIYILVLLTYTEMGIWNKVIFEGLGIGKENWNPLMFSPISFFTILTVSMLSRYWFSLIDTWKFSLYIVIINLLLWVL